MAEALVQRFDARLSTLTRRPTSRLRAIGWSAGQLSGKNTTFDDIATAAGLENLAATESISGHRELPLEQVLAWNPDVVVTQCSTEDCDAAARTLAESPGWAATAAAENGRVVAVPGRHLFSVGWGMLEALQWIVERTTAG